MSITQIKENFKNLNWTVIVMWLLIIIGIILRLKVYLLNQSFSINECMLGTNINNKNSYLDFFMPLELVQCAPPFFMIICNIILDISNQSGHFYNQDLMLRLFPCICSIVSLPLFATFIQKITTNKTILLVSVAMLSFNNCLIYYSQQFKQYSCEMMFSLILLLIFHSIDIKKASIKKISFYVLIFILSIWFSNSAILILFVGYLLLFYEIIKNKYLNLAKIAVLLIPIIINFINYYYIYFKNTYNTYSKYMYYYWTYSQPSFFDFSNFIARFTHKMQILINTPFHKFLILFLILNIFILFKKNTFSNKAKFLILAPIILSIFTSFMKIYPFESRLILFLLPLFIILYAQIVTLVKFNNKLLFLLSLVFICISIYHLAIPPNFLLYKKDNCFREYSQFIIDNKINPNHIIMTNTEQLEYYLFSYFKTGRPLLEENIWVSYKNAKLPQKIKNISKGEYWLICPYSIKWCDYNHKIKDYVRTNKNLKIIKIWEDSNDKNIFIIHFAKII